MSFINFQSFDPLFLETKGKQNLRGLKICVPPLYKHSYEKLNRYHDFANFVKSSWSDFKRVFNTGNFPGAISYLKKASITKHVVIAMQFCLFLIMNTRRRDSLTSEAEVLMSSSFLKPQIIRPTFFKDPK